MAVSLKRLDSIPDMLLKSQFRSDILLLSLGLKDAVFFGFEPKTILLVLLDAVGLLPLNTA